MLVMLLVSSFMTAQGYQKPLFDVAIVNGNVSSVSVNWEDGAAVTAANREGFTFDHWESRNGAWTSSWNSLTVLVYASSNGASVEAIYTQNAASANESNASASNENNTPVAPAENEDASEYNVSFAGEVNFFAASDSTIPASVTMSANTELVFRVEPIVGFSLENVTINGEQAEPDKNGWYKLTVNSNTNVYASTVDVNVPTHTIYLLADHDDYIIATLDGVGDNVITYVGQSLPNKAIAFQQLVDYGNNLYLYEWTFSGHIKDFAIHYSADKYAALNSSTRLTYVKREFGANISQNDYIYYDLRGMLNMTEDNTAIVPADIEAAPEYSAQITPNAAFDMVKISSMLWTSLYSDKNLVIPAGVKVMYVSSVEDSKMILTRIYDVIPANTPVVMNGPEGQYPFFEYQGDETVEPITDNLLIGFTTKTVVDNQCVHYALGKGSTGEVGFWWPKGTGATNGVGAFTATARKAYVEIPATANVSVRGFVADATESETVETIATAVENVETNVENGLYYDMLGRVVEPVCGQFYIHNGEVIMYLR